MASPYGESYRRLIEVVAQVRKEAGLEPGELSKRLGQSRMFIYKIETMRRRVDPSEIADIARAMGVDPLSLFARWLSAEDAANRGT